MKSQRCFVLDRTEVVCFLTHVNVVEDLRASSRVGVELRLP